MARDIVRRNATPLASIAPEQDRAISALLSGSTVTAAAKEAKVDRATVHRWMSEDPAFIAAYNSYRIEMGDAVRQQLRFLAAESVKTIRDILADKSAPAAVRLKAATDVLGMVSGDDLKDRPVNEAAIAAKIKNQEIFASVGQEPKRLT